MLQALALLPQDVRRVQSWLVTGAESCLASSFLEGSVLQSNVPDVNLVLHLQVCTLQGPRGYLQPRDSITTAKAF